ncbi:BTB/POZ domain-containing protein 19-like [Ptychodera flava]|uniref:BTB/POZ domain-containing protein 19-like n=1 Tax=Ptychodera flava TaxID=63121 RepID=UPI003969C496
MDKRMKTQTSDHLQVVGSFKPYVSSLSGLFNNPDLSDVVLKVGEVSYHAHRFLLAHFSDVMRTMLTESRWQDSQQAEVKLEETRECAGVFKSFLRFMYTGQVALNVSRARPMLALADKYNIALLKSVCEDYMVRQVIQSGNVSEALQWWEHAKTYNLKHLGLECLALIKESLNAAIKTPEWLNLSIDQLCTILESSDVVVKDEYTLYRGVETWLQCANHKANISEYLDRILPLLRFSQMTPQQIDAIEKSSLCERFSNKFIRYVLQAYKLFVMGRKMVPENPNVAHQPREYGQSPLQETKISVDFRSLEEESYPSYQHKVTVHLKTMATGTSYPQSPSIRPNLDICRKPSQSGDSYGLWLRILPEWPSTYSVRIRLIDGQSRKTLSVVRGSGKVGEKTPHVAYVDIQDRSYHNIITEMFTVQPGLGSNTSYYYMASMPIVCAFLGMKHLSAYNRLSCAITVIFYN